MSRRNVLIGLGVTGAGTLAVLDNFTDVLEGGNSSIREDPPLTNPNNDDSDDNDSAFQTPWDADELVIAVEWNEQDSTFPGWFEDAFPTREGQVGADDVLQNAVEFWNDYIEANSESDLTLTFDHHHDNPDILLKQANHMGECGPEYNGPGFGNRTWSAEACVETLQETPTEDDLPVTGTIGRGGTGRGVYRLIAQHAIGRLLGQPIWSDPVDVMNPKILITPSHSVSTSNSTFYKEPSRATDGLSHFKALTIDALNDVQNPSNDTEFALEGLRQTTNSHLDQMNRTFDEFLSLVDEFGLDVYADAYRETIETEDIQYLNDTVALITEALDTYTRAELADGPDELDVIADRLETIRNWPNTTEPYDVRIHRYATDEIWSAWAAEQTPTETDSANNSA